MRGQRERTHGAYQMSRANALAAASALPPRMAAAEREKIAKRQEMLLSASEAWPNLFTTHAVDTTTRRQRAAPPRPRSAAAAASALKPRSGAAAAASPRTGAASALKPRSGAAGAASALTPRSGAASAASALRPSTSVPQLSGANRRLGWRANTALELENTSLKLTGADLEAKAAMLTAKVAKLQARNAALRRELAGRPTPPTAAEEQLLRRALESAKKEAVDDARRSTSRPSWAKRGEAEAEAEWSAEAWLGSLNLHSIVARNLVSRLKERSQDVALERPFVEALGDRPHLFEALAEAEWPLQEEFTDAIWEGAKRLTPE